LDLVEDGLNLVENYLDLAEDVFLKKLLLERLLLKRLLLERLLLERLLLNELLNELLDELLNELLNELLDELLDGLLLLPGILGILHVINVFEIKSPFLEIQKDGKFLES